MNLFRLFFITAGLICTGIGAAAVALPFLPATPFFLLAIFLFAKSSTRLENWLKGTRIYRENLESLSRGEGMTQAAKLRIIMSVTAVMGIAEIFMLRAYFLKGSAGALWGSVIMALVWAAHIFAFFFVVKTCPQKGIQKGGKEDDTGKH